MDIEKLDINAVCFGILCNFTPVCGEEKAKEAVKKMAEQRLIDANKILYHQAWESGSMEPANEGVALMSEVQAMPTIDPEALPIVRQLREELARVTAERDAAQRLLAEHTGVVGMEKVTTCAEKKAWLRRYQGSLRQEKELAEEVEQLEVEI